MKFALQTLPLFVIVGAVLAHAQPVPGQFQHVIVVIQENRTPDNLFAGVPPQNSWTGPWFESGVDLAIAPQAPQDKGGQTGQPWCLGACFDPGHQNSVWQQQFQNGLPPLTRNPSTCQTDGSQPTYCSLDQNGNSRPVCSYWNNNWPACNQPNHITLPAWPEESYVSWDYDKDANGNSVLSPYVQIATNYGFANYFYQTNQGPSEPAHDFLFGGTSAPTGIVGQNNYYNYFAAENPRSNQQGQKPFPAGCEAPAYEYVPLVDPTGAPVTFQQNPCLEHNTLADLLKSSGLSWKYYSDETGGIWTAPNAINHICVPAQQPDGSIKCTGSDFTQNVVPAKNFFLDFQGGGTNLIPPPGQPPYCNLPSVAWTIPDGKNSDHPGSKGYQYSTAIEGGPNWVADIVDHVGQATCVEPSGPWKGYSPWYDTVIFVVWDDWGGFYDHVGQGYLNNDLIDGGTCMPGYQGLQWGCGYTYGFRVPFLVISAYTPAGTVSGGCGSSGLPPCGPQSNIAPHQHDFGSILAFIEFNFGLQQGGINLANGFPFADYYAPELRATGGPYVPLGDFFTVNAQAPLGFRQIVPVSNSFTVDYFNNFNGPYTDPDNDVIDND